MTVRYSSLQRLILSVYLPDDAESPTVVLDRIDGTPSPLQKLHLGAIVPPITVAEGVVTPDPFRDVIRTEPAPDLPSLIEDMMPYLLERHTSVSTTPISTTISRSFTTPTQERKTTSAPITFTHISTPSDRNVPITTDLFEENNNSNRGQLEEQTPHDVELDDDLNTEEDKDEDSGISLDSVLQFLFYNEDTTRSPSRATHKTTSQHFGSGSSTSQGRTAASHDTPATPPSQNSSEEDDDKNKSESTTAQLNTSSDNEQALNLTTDSTATNTKLSTKPHAVLTTVSNDVNPTASSRESPPEISPVLQHPQLRAPVSADPGAASGLLKLAGCNIYGRMYRVGRIISELSGPCLECMCTEVGVQCRPLDC
jgi:hypothetical protein